ncbi:hypothetical protein LINPERPRIM_LOCUS16888 [Linum perenne]
METTIPDAQSGNDSLDDFCEEKESSRGITGLANPESKSRMRRINSKNNSIISKVRHLQKSKTWMKGSFLHRVQIVDDWIPKHMVTVDEKYLHRCLHLINVSASRTSPCTVSIDSSFGSLDVWPNGFSPVKVGNEYINEFSRFDLNCTTLETGNGSLVAGPAGDWIIGSIMGSKSMVNILQSPLLREYGNIGESNSKSKGTICHELMNSPGGSSSYSSFKPDMDTRLPRSYRNVSDNSHERLFSISSTNSTFSDHSSSLSSSAAVSQGMLQFTWKGGNPHFVLSLDDQKVVYVANLWKAESGDGDSLDYTYLFHSRTSGKQVHDIHGHDSHLVGKMVVSTSFTLSENNSRTMLREFVLFGGNESFMDMQSSNIEYRKNRRLSKKVSDVFRKKRSLSKFGGSGTILEDSAWGPFQDTDHCNDSLGGCDLLEKDLPSNFELTAIVVKEYVPEIRQEKIGGWGLKFLQKASDKQHTGNVEPLTTSASCARAAGDCSTSMDIILPAGLHGGPRTRNCGPASLIERWKSGGCCDCGGWDLGCPLTVLKGRSKKKDLLLPSDGQGDCRLVDLFIQGSENTAPPLRITNVHDGLYFVHFQSTLSAVQSFSIAVAFIHSQSPALRPKSVQEA